MRSYLFGFRFIKHSVLLSAICCSSVVYADYRMLVGIDPAEKRIVSLSAGVSKTLDALTKLLRAPVAFKQTSDLTDVMRASRTAENDILIGPAHVAASAISHQYQLLARQKSHAEYVLVARNDVSGVNQLAGKRLYLTQQDSVRSYVAKGILGESHVGFKALKKVTFGKTSGAGLLALDANIADVTIVSKDELDNWTRSNAGTFKILKKTDELPSGLAVMVKKSLSDGDKSKIRQWALSADAEFAGFGQMEPTNAADEASYGYIASMGILTPQSVPGVAVVTSGDVQRLREEGALIVDTRSQKEFERMHIKGAIHAPYVESSLKERDFDASLDDYSGILKFNKSAPVVFYCNGPECWKSYKASVVAKRHGMANVFWYRGGIPDWSKHGLPADGKSVG